MTSVQRGRLASADCQEERHRIEQNSNPPLQNLCQSAVFWRAGWSILKFVLPDGALLGELRPE